jgi:hypothetical protein
MSDIDTQLITGTFVVVVNNEWKMYKNYVEIPEVIDKAVSCIPNPPEGSENWGEHGDLWIETMNLIIEDLRSRETKSNGSLIDSIPQVEQPVIEEHTH